MSLLQLAHKEKDITMSALKIGLAVMGGGGGVDEVARREAVAPHGSCSSFFFLFCENHIIAGWIR